MNEHLTTPHTKLEAANGIPPFEAVRLLEAGTPALGGDDLAAFFDVVAARYGVAYARLHWSVTGTVAITRVSAA